MSAARHTILGKAFEYACAIALRDAICAEQAVIVENSLQFQQAEEYFSNKLTEKEREKIVSAAKAGVRILLRYEPQLSFPNGNEPLYISLVADNQGQAGDVRDVLFVRKQNNWEIGVSCKHNHTAVKHSRLSDKLDFGHKWFGIACSEKYFSDITPIFEELRKIKNASNGQAKWNTIGGNDAKLTLYKKVLTAFAEELKRLDSENPGTIAAKLISYLIGVHDFYKIIAIDRDRTTEIQAFNIYGSLNASSGKKKSISDIRKLKLPTKFHKIDFFEENGCIKENTLAIYCDCGWEVTLRIHNASSRVEPSLKFDVQLITYPREIRSQIEPWD